DGRKHRCCRTALARCLIAAGKHASISVRDIRQNWTKPSTVGLQMQPFGPLPWSLRGSTVSNGTSTRGIGHGEVLGPLDAQAAGGGYASSDSRPEVASQ